MQVSHYSNKRNVLQLCALLGAHGIEEVVLCPGSRNAPICQTLSCMEGMHCHAVTDERSAGFFAIGIALAKHIPVAVCCTSGSALLNLYPAVAEAYYRHIPLIIISADRPKAWIGQMDGQTIPQENVFGSLVSGSYNLPEIRSEEDAWHSNRLINEALLEINHHVKGPVHINIPISEPLFDFTATSLPKERIITRHYELPDFDGFAKIMIIVGQQEHYFKADNFAIFYDHISNVTGNIRGFDYALQKMSEAQKQSLAPDLVITCGGHILSKKLKNYIKQNPPKEHWHISENGEIADLFCCLTKVVEMPFQDSINEICDRKADREYSKLWNTSIKNPDLQKLPFSGLLAVKALIDSLPEHSVLHLANSNAVRYAELCHKSASVRVFCNRGVNGIEGSLSTAIGFASSCAQLNFLIIGDLSFFYDMNALNLGSNLPNLKILLLNNGGGGIFKTLPGLDRHLEAEKFITAARPHLSAEGWAKNAGYEYHCVKNKEELKKKIKIMTSPVATKPLLVEVITDMQQDADILKQI